MGKQEEIKLAISFHHLLFLFRAKLVNGGKDLPTDPIQVLATEKNTLILYFNTRASQSQQKIARQQLLRRAYEIKTFRLFSNMEEELDKRCKYTIHVMYASDAVYSFFRISCTFLEGSQLCPTSSSRHVSLSFRQLRSLSTMFFNPFT